MVTAMYYADNLSGKLVKLWLIQVLLKSSETPALKVDFNQ